MRALWTLGIAAVVCLLATSASAGTIYEIDYASYDVSLTDTQGVKTDLTEFGFWTGPNILVAQRGDAKVEIPFRRIRSLTIQKYIPVKGYSPATVTTKKGKTYKLEIEIITTLKRVFYFSKRIARLAVPDEERAAFGDA